ncbi:hypothetical protein BLNAU_22956 [Blattamonas nauphoetae]|uniref:Uncharacterized protein n=1 Tax=Blattamonas nauphoetae TaxID=2049346 RepID=A0ABQ9WS24_9EUKA|nr:hypothetical protein BLNAU_22956 [Blattamonas nauphoetae]
MSWNGRLFSTLILLEQLLAPIHKLMVSVQADSLSIFSLKSEFTDTLSDLLSHLSPSTLLGTISHKSLLKADQEILTIVNETTMLGSDLHDQLLRELISTDDPHCESRSGFSHLTDQFGHLFSDISEMSMDDDLFNQLPTQVTRWVSPSVNGIFIRCFHESQCSRRFASSFRTGLSNTTLETLFLVSEKGPDSLSEAEFANQEKSPHKVSGSYRKAKFTGSLGGLDGADGRLGTLHRGNYPLNVLGKKRKKTAVSICV